MTESEFWTLISRTRDEAQGVVKRQFELIQAALAALPEGKILAFVEIHAGYASDAFAWPLWAAAYAIGDGCSDDGFSNFCDWLISRGEGPYGGALRDPATLAQVFANGTPGDGRDDAYQGESFWDVAWAAFQTSTGRQMPALRPSETETRGGTPAGAPWEVEEPDRLYPGIAALRSSLPGLVRAGGAPRVAFSIEEFWSFIDEANETHPEPSPLDFPMVWLEWEVGELIAERILSFAWRFAAAIDEAVSSPALRAFAARGGAAAETRPSELAAWLVMAGRPVYEGALDRPRLLEDTLARLAARGRSYPQRTFSNFPLRAWVRNTGMPADEMPRRRS